MAKFFEKAYSIFKRSLGLPEVVPDPPLSPEERAEQATFYRAIQADLDDDGPRLMYADWLEERGGESRVARAEFVRRQCAAPFDSIAAGNIFPSPRPSSAGRAGELFERHGTDWERELGLVGEGWLLPFTHVGFRRWRRGFPDSLQYHLLPARPDDALANALPFAREWECPLAPDWLDHFRAILDAGDAANLHRLRLSGAGLDDDAIAAIVDSPNRPKLRSLELAHGVVRAGVAMVLAAPFAGDLVDLSFAQCQLGDAEIRTLAESSSLGGLRSLDLSGNPFGDDGAVALSRSRHLKRLVRLDLRDTAIGPRGRAAIRESARLRRDCEFVFSGDGATP